MRKSVVILTVVLFATLTLPLAAKACGGGGDYMRLDPRMVVGGQGMTTFTASGDPLRVRAEPGLDGQYLTRLQNGTHFAVINGPVKKDGYTWWQIAQIEANGSMTGWVAESGDGEYWIKPL